MSLFSISSIPYDIAQWCNDFALVTFVHITLIFIFFLFDNKEGEKWKTLDNKSGNFKSIKFFLDTASSPAQTNLLFIFHNPLSRELQQNIDQNKT